MNQGDHWAADVRRLFGLKAVLEPAEPSATRWPASRVHRVVAISTLAVLSAILIIFEMRSSWLQAQFLSSTARRLTFNLAAGPSPSIRYPSDGPYDRALGYARLPDFLKRLDPNGYQIAAQARDSQLSILFTRVGLFPAYSEKDRAGLQLIDRDGRTLYRAQYPRRVYEKFDDIPPLVVNTLLFSENRDLLDARRPYRNPAIEWDRLGKAVIDLGIHTVDRRYPVIGASTLATQLEKMRHSTGGRTGSVVEKGRQIAAASIHAYQDGPDTIPAQRRIIRDYINSIPLAASAGYGEVTGLGDGLWVWYGADFKAVNDLLAAPEHSLSQPEMLQRAKAFRQALSLLLALRHPTRYLVQDPHALAVQTDRYLRALAADHVISPRLRDLALSQSAVPRPNAPPRDPVVFADNKAAYSIRGGLVTLLGLDNTYDLDRLDLKISTTLDSATQDAVTKFLRDATDPQQAAAAGLVGHRLLASGNPESVIYSFTLYERANGANLLRVQADNYNQPLDINQGTKLELGSTAKLRTLVNYLQIVEGLHAEYSALTPAQLSAVQTYPNDHITQWALHYLAATADRSLPAMLQAALDRTYSASTAEAFFTAGGLHHFENFEGSDNGRILTIREAFHRSVNLVFIRLMRDIENYYVFRVPGASPAILDDPDNPARRLYLARFANLEGKQFLTDFYQKYHGQTPDQALDTLLHSVVHLTPLRATVIYRSVRPQASFDDFTAFLEAHTGPKTLYAEDVAEYYDKYGPDKFDLGDRGYLARVHPLELWLLNYLEHHPQATLRQVFAASANQRQEVYAWLYKTRYKDAQDKRIRILMEIDAFTEIARAWKRVGYPFDSLVPSYATTIGVSGDTPTALAELAGVIVNDGMRYPSIRIREMHYAQDTPYETILDRRLDKGQRVMSREVASVVRQEMVGVVESGTAARANRSVVLPDKTAVELGGKTGTGDNRFEVFSRGGGVVASRVVNRTATFVFFIDDRFFGAITAFVPGEQAEGYGFTSSLPVQIFKDLAPRLVPLIERARAGDPALVARR